ncbi:MAG TPA: sigma-70 family RNA polymerase sigma factor [Blastocatellia bacterium]|nr:sigma-70 family RNA polymerase sigma factor [Blastocatellia bacterium]
MIKCARLQSVRGHKERMPDLSGAEAGSKNTRLENLADEELVDQFLLRLTTDKESAHQSFEAIIARYKGLIVHIVRGSRYRFPEWDSADDVIARAVFKIYRGLAQWRRQGKLSSFIARITTSEMIDTMRRVRRDKSWTPRRSAVEPDDDTPSPVERAASKEPTPEAMVLTREQREIIDRLLAEVCRDWKDSVIVNEYIIGGLDARVISEKYSMSEDLVYQRARRLRVRLMKWLAERGITSADQLLGAGT